MLIPGIEVRPSPPRGRGLFTTADIPAGCVVWLPCPECEVWSPEQMAAMPEERQHWMSELGYRLADGSELMPCHDACLMNHSCRPNLLDYGLDFGLAVRDIAAGEELTLDYRTFRSDPDWSFPCACGAPDCAREIAPSAEVPARLAATWSTRMAEPLRRIARVEQPLHQVVEACSAVYRQLRTNPAEYRLDPAVSILAPSFLSRPGAR